MCPVAEAEAIYRSLEHLIPIQAPAAWIPEWTSHCSCVLIEQDSLSKGAHLADESVSGNPGWALATRAQEALLATIDGAVESRWEPARRRAAAAPGSTIEERVKAIRGLFAHELTVLGAATGGAAAAPVVGTAVAISATIAELGWIAIRLTDLILTLAIVHGHDKASVEERRAWIFTIMGVGGGAAGTVTKFASEAGKGLGLKATKRIPMTMIRKFNGYFSRTIITKYGTSRGVIHLGQTLPFGIGAVIGAGGNYITIRALVAETDRFFRRLPMGESPPVNLS